MKRSLSIVMLILAGAACADTSPSSPGGIDHPTGRGDLLLSVSHEGGFVPAEYTFTELSTFSLYGDGTIITPGAQIELYPGPALPPILAREVSEEGIQEILVAALEAGLDRDGDHSDLGNVAVADAATTVFRFNIDGQTHVVKAYALEFPNDGEDPRREQLRSFQEQLGRIDSWLPEGSLGDERPFDPDGARLLIGLYRPVEDLAQAPKDWPLPSDLADAGEPIDTIPDSRCLALDGAGWAEVEAMAREANQLTPWISEGREYSLTFRPFLPDESGC